MVGGMVEVEAVLRIAYSNQTVGSWKKLGGGWVGVKAVLRIAYSNQKKCEVIFGIPLVTKYCQSLDTFSLLYTHPQYIL